MGEIKSLVDRWWDAFEGGDAAAAGAVTSDDIELRIPGLEVRGRDQVQAAIEAYNAAFPDMRHEFVDWIESGDTFAAELRVTGTHTGPMQTPGGAIPPTGKQVAWQSCDYIKARDGKIVSWARVLRPGRVPHATRPHARDGGADGLTPRRSHGGRRLQSAA